MPWRLFFFYLPVLVILAVILGWMSGQINELFARVKKLEDEHRP